MDPFRPRFLGQVALRRSYLGMTPQDEAHSLLLQLDQFMGFKNELGDIPVKYPWVNDPNYIHYDGVKIIMQQVADLTPSVMEIRTKWIDPAITAISDSDKKTVSDWASAISSLRNLIAGGYINKNSVPMPPPIGQPVITCKPGSKDCGPGPSQPATSAAPIQAATQVQPLPQAPVEPPSNVLPVAAGVGVVAILAAVVGGLFGK